MLRPGDVIIIRGPLGSGKTTLVQGVARALGVRVPVTSPTFVLRKRYAVPRHAGCSVRWLHHVDAYRLRSWAALRSILDEEASLARHAVWFVEWGSRFQRVLLGARTLVITLSIAGNTARRIRVQTPRRRPVGR